MSSGKSKSPKQLRIAKRKRAKQLRIAKWVGLAALALVVAYSMLPAPRVIDDDMMFSAPMERRIHGRLEAAAADGKPCIFLLGGHDQNELDSLREAAAAEIAARCPAEDGLRSAPVFIEFTGKSSIMDVEMSYAHRQAFDLDHDAIMAAKDRAYEERRKEHWEAAAWIMIDAVLQEQTRVPFIVATNDRPLRRFIRAIDILLISLTLVLAFTAWISSLGGRGGGGSSSGGSSTPGGGAQPFQPSTFSAMGASSYDDDE